MRSTATAARSTAARSITVATGLLAAGVLAACASSNHSGGKASSASPGPALASATVGSLVITGGYIPAPASPDVAAAYLTITNNGDTADQLSKVTTSVTSTVLAMNQIDTGSVGSMTDLADVTVPAHGSTQFVPDHAHLMLENPKQLKAGDQVSMTLTFTPGGTVTITLPVLPLGQLPTPVPTTKTTSPSSGMSSMPGMSGMSGMSH